MPLTLKLIYYTDKFQDFGGNNDVFDLDHGRPWISIYIQLYPFNIHLISIAKNGIHLYPIKLIRVPKEYCSKRGFISAVKISLSSEKWPWHIRNGVPGCAIFAAGAFGIYKTGAVSIKEIQAGRIIAGTTLSGVDAPKVGLCHGDSGGAAYLANSNGQALAEASGQLIVAGINSTLISGVVEPDTAVDGVVARVDLPDVQAWVRKMVMSGLPNSRSA